MPKYDGMDTDNILKTKRRRDVDYTGQDVADDEGMKKRKSELDEDFTEEDALEGELPGDLGSGTKVGRPGWRKGIYAELWRRNWMNNSKKLVCEICNHEIKLTAKSHAGKEIYDFPGAYKKQTRPHIDHDQPDWIDRYTTISQIIAHANPKFTDEEERKILSWGMNAPILRIVHRKCNLSKAKAFGNPSRTFEKTFDRKSL